MTEDAPAQSRPRTSWTYWSLWACFILLVAYPLSTGPVILILDRLDVDSDLLEAIYAPLILLADTFEPVEGFFMWYLMDVWGL